MAHSVLETVMNDLRRVLLCQGETGVTDGQLLGAFIERRDEFAFETLMRRHGPMVLGVCRRILGNDADADDAFQATFLVLVRKAASAWPRGKVGHWLYGVARSTASKARAMSSKRAVKERAACRNPAPAENGDGLIEMLDEELPALPEKYRAVIVLCDLEGRSLKDAARQLGCPLGTVGTRLARGRALLAGRLARRDVSLPAGALAAALAQGTASATLPPALVNSTVMAATATAAGPAATAGVISAHVAALTEGVLKAMMLAKLKIAMVYVLAASTLGFAAAWASSPNEALAPKQVPVQAADRPAGPAANAEQEKKNADIRWGEPVGGVRIRLRASQTTWRKGEIPELSADLSNDKGGELALRRLPRCEVEVDGEWYVSMEGMLVAGATTVREGDLAERFAVIRLAPNDDKQLAGRWVRKSAVKSDRELLLAAADVKNRLTLSVGKHVLRIAADIDHLVGDRAVRTGRAVSNRVEIEIVEPK